MSIEKISIAKMSHDEWLEERRKGVGDSNWQN